MNDFTIRPTLKFIKAGAIAAALVFLALEILYFAEWQEKLPTWVIALPPLVLLWPLVRWLKTRAVRIVVTPDRMRYEAGLLSHEARNIELSKLQCVNVHQSIIQRLFRVGTIGYETAGQATWTPMAHVDNPQQIADELMNRAQGPAHA
ncbi:MAG TPA: PH domain-containing protein [Bryobacteraceae bacterium]|nr:PH domain-containing protein [Bryobacteraceae bacterium]